MVGGAPIENLRVYVLPETDLLDTEGWARVVSACDLFWGWFRHEPGATGNRDALV